MKNVKTFVVAAIFSLTSFGSFAVEQVVQPVHGQQEIGAISASGALTLTDLESELACKAKNAGASSYRITSVTGNNKLHADAEIYK